MLPAVEFAPARAAPQMQSPATDLVISEFRLQGSGGSNDEFIEIFNPTSAEVNLNGWIIRGANASGNSGIRYEFGTDISLLPGQHYLLVHTGYDDAVEADAVYLQAIPDNGGVALVKPDPPDTIADQVGLSDGTLYKEGTPLSPFTSNTDQSYERKYETSGICTDSQNNASDFVLRNPSDPQNFSSPVTTTCGNPTATPTPTTTSTATATSTAAGITTPLILINEVAWSGTLATPGTSTTPGDEWIELYNPSATEIDLDGWVLRSNDNTPNIALSGTMPPGSFLVLARNAGTFQSPVNYQVESSINLSDSGEILTLVDTNPDPDRIIDTANSDGGTWPAGTAASTYASMERIGVTNQWITYGGSTVVAYDRNNNPVRGTPGRSNWISGITITTITADTPDPSLVNQNVSVSVNVIGGMTVPTGIVSITGTNSNCTITLTSASAGRGSCTVRFTSTGSKNIIATYSGDASHPASSDTELHTVSITVPTRTPTRVPTLPPPPPLLVINEFVPRPGHDWNMDGVINTNDEYIEILNHGVIDVNLNGYSLDDEVNIGSTPFRLPADVTLKPGERRVFYGSETGLLLSDGGDGVRLLRPNGQLMDAYNYRVARFPDHTYCRMPDNGGADDWNENCFPTPGLQNSLSGSAVNPPTSGDAENLCPIADTLPEDFLYAECLPFGNNIWNPAYWDRFGWYNERNLPESPGKWPVFVD